MAGNALCEVVVCAEEDLRMLEDELGRIDGKLSPRDPDGPAGRVTSTGYYGSEIMAMPTGTTTGTMTAPDSQPRVLMRRNSPSIPRSPTVRFLPQSASKLGIDGTAEYTPSSEGSQEARDVRANNRVNDFLLSAADRRRSDCRWPNANNLIVTQPAQARTASLLEKLRQSSAQEQARANNNPAGASMGLVAWQRLNGRGTPEVESPETMKRSNSHPTDLTAFNKPYDPAHTQSADQPQPALRPAQQQQQQQHLGVPTPPPATWRNSWHPAYTRETAAGAGGAGGEAYGGFNNVARPVSQAPRGVSATASNTVLFKEVQDRAAALARAPGRWVVGGAGLTNYDGARGSAAEDSKKRAEDPFA